ncbi:MAG TPA: hypothetical protein VLX29_01700 [Nitrospirota bacterium]|nr:hypothetical protein [Nitrospirota bacterium]
MKGIVLLLALLLFTNCTKEMTNSQAKNNFADTTINSQTMKVPPTFNEIELLLSKGNKVTLFFVAGPEIPISGESDCFGNQREQNVKDTYASMFGKNRLFSITSNKSDATHILKMYCDTLRHGPRTSHIYNAKLIDNISQKVLASDFIEN